MFWFRKIKQIGFGAYSTVWLYKHRITFQHVAVKKMKAGCASALNEIKCLSIFKGNPRICQMVSKPIYSVKNTYCILQYYPNGDLFDTLQTHYLTVSNIQKLMLELSTILKVCHDKQIAHLDIKPENFMFDKDMNLVLIDFGMSKSFDHPNTLYFSSHSLGSESYASPETCLQMYCAKSDIWSLGIIFRYLCSRLSEPNDAYEALLDHMLHQDVHLRPTANQLVSFFQ